MLYVIAASMILFTAAVFTVFGEGSVDTRNTEFLKAYGWEVSEKSIESSPVNIPAPFDLVYESYNEMQREAGLDLRPYAGEKAVRYTYIVNNFPYEVSSEVRANVLCVRGEPIGGDVMTVAADGFMEPLSFLEKISQSI